MKRMLAVPILLITIVIVGCQDKVPKYKPSPEDVVNRYVEVENVERFQEFYHNVLNGKKDAVRVVNYTTEGDPLLHDLEYDGDVIKSTFDTRRDKFGEGSLHTATCNAIEVIETSQRTEYLLEGCGDYGYDEIITILHK
jgi:hypothetical protein